MIPSCVLLLGPPSERKHTSNLTGFLFNNIIATSTFSGVNSNRSKHSTACLPSSVIRRTCFNQSEHSLFHQSKPVVTFPVTCFLLLALISSLRFRRDGYMCFMLHVFFPLRTSVSLIQLSSPLSRPPTPLSDTLDGTPSWSLPIESILQQQSRQKVKMQPRNELKLLTPNMTRSRYLLSSPFPSLVLADH